MKLARLMAVKGSPWPSPMSGVKGWTGRSIKVAIPDWCPRR